MRFAILLVTLATMVFPAATAPADGGSNPPSTGTTSRVASPPAASNPAVQRYGHQRGNRRGWFSGRSAKNWYLNRGTPDDNSTIPTPVNRNPKGRPKNSPVIFPKNM